MERKNYILATAGHVDHGKSSLVKALTSTDPDRLPEEKERGITIDLGFASLDLSKGDEVFHLGIIDVPGHEDFVKNMVAGVGSIDLALLVIAADDSWMPQTEEHVQILSYLGITKAVVALTKIDLPEADAELAIEMVREELAGTSLAGAPIVGTSVVTGEGIEELKQTLAELVSQTPPPADIGKPRLPVDRVFTLKGIGTVVTGTLTGGVLERGQTVCLQPSGQTSRLRSIQAHNADAASVGPGTRTAVNLPDLGHDTSHGAAGVARGDILMLEGAGETSDAIDVLLERSPRLDGGQYSVNRPLKNNLRVRVHCGSGNFPARILFREKMELLPGQSEIAELRFETPVFVMAGDRFIVRDWPEQATLAGGVVLDERAVRKRFRTPEQVAFLQSRADHLNDLGAWISAQLKRDAAASKSDILRQSRFGAGEIEAATAVLVAKGAAKERGGIVADAGEWDAIHERTAALVDARHKAHPEQQGLPLTEIRTALGGRLRSPEAIDLILVDLCADGFTRRGAVMAREGHQPSLPARLRSGGERMRGALAANPMEPPRRKELAPDAAGLEVLKFLVDTGEVIELSAETVLMKTAYDEMAAGIVGWIKTNGPATASDLRQAAGTNRRIIMPMLERIDREGITVRDGDKRKLTGKELDTTSLVPETGS